MKTRYILLLMILSAPFLFYDCTYAPASSEAFDELAMRAVAGDLPDIVYMDGLRVAEFIQQGYLKPLPRERFELDDFYTQLLAPFEHEGELYAIPRDFQPLALLVNAELLGSYGYEVPKDWATLMEVASNLTQLERSAENSDFYTIGLTSGLYSYLPFYFQAGGELYGEGGATLGLNSPAGLESLSFYASLTATEAAVVVDGSWPEVGAYGALLDRFVEGSIAMAIVGPRMYDIVLSRLGEGADPQRALLAPLPVGPDGPATIANVRAFALTGEPTETNLALLEHLTSAEGLARWIGDGSTPSDYIPARRSLQSLWRDAHPAATAFSTSVEFVRSYTPPPISTGFIAEFDRLAQPKLFGVLAGELDPAAALAEIEKTGNAFLAEP